MIIKKWCASCGQFRKEGKQVLQGRGRNVRKLFRCVSCIEVRKNKLKENREALKTP